MSKKRLIFAAAGIALVIVLIATVGPGRTPGPPEGDPVELTVVIRSDLSPYPDAGHYVADQLEELGFRVVRLVREGDEARALWQDTPPGQGAMSVYTGGWLSPSIPRDQGDAFDWLYTHRIMPYPLWGILSEQLAEFPEFDDASRALRFGDFSDMAEREELFEIVLWEAMRFSNCIWTVDVAGAGPFRSEVAVAVDAAGGIGDPNWVHTVHFHDEGVPRVPDGTTRLKVEQPGLMMHPWNPVEGSAFAYDLFITGRALGDAGCLPDPREGEEGGLFWPHRVESADVWADGALPVVSSLPWLTLTAADDPIQTPHTAWADWDAEAQQFITVGEKLDTGSEYYDEEFDPVALTKVRVEYPADLFDIPLHDGSTLSMADFLMSMIMTFDRGKEDSPIFDGAEQASLELWLDRFKGVKIIETAPLVIETYSDAWHLDAERMVNESNWFPRYGTYDWTGFWHMITVGWLAEHWPRLDGFPTDIARMAFSKDKSDEFNVQWMDYTKGDSLPVLKECLDWAADHSYIPYEDAIREFYAGYFADGSDLLDWEIAERWQNLEEFHDEWGHFWVGNGPYLLTETYPVAKIIVMERFADYPDDAGRWLFFVEPGPIDVPAHTGAWVDEVVVTAEPDHAKAILKLAANDIDLYAAAVTDLELYDTIETDPDLQYRLNYGAYRDLRFNTYRNPDTKEPFFVDGRLNPFAIPEIREAMNWAIDRDYIVDEHLGGMGSAKWTVLGTAFPDHARYYADIIAPIEAYYEYDFARADAAIEQAMLAIDGVSRDEDGRYRYSEPED